MASMAAASKETGDPPFASQLSEIRRARGYSRNELSRRTGHPGVSEAAIVKLEREPERIPADATAIALGDALRAAATEFPAYALARARRLLNEHEVGLNTALANLATFGAALSSGTRSEADRADREALEIAEAAAQRREDRRKRTGEAKRRRGAEGSQP